MLSANHDVRLESTTHLILVPRRLLAVVAGGGTAGAGAPGAAGASGNGSRGSALAVAPPPPPPPPEPVNETEVCEGACGTAGPVEAVGPETKFRSLAIAGFGYAPRETHEVSEFGYEASLLYLDGQNLLFAFDPHKLRERAGGGGGVVGGSTRTVRAVLIDGAGAAVSAIGS